MSIEWRFLSELNVLHKGLKKSENDQADPWFLNDDFVLATVNNPNFFTDMWNSYCFQEKAALEKPFSYMNVIVLLINLSPPYLHTPM